MKNLTSPGMAKLTDMGVTLPRVIAALLFAAFVSGLWSTLNPILKPTTGPVASIAHAPTTPVHAAVDAAVVDMHIFGTAATQEGSASLASQSIEIAVLGILASDKEEYSLALLSIGGTAANYSVGQSLPDGELVAHIEPTAVVLRQSGGERRVEMEIGFADSNATFHKASTQGDDKDSWSDVYLDGAAGDAPAKARHTGILSVAPAAANPNVKALSLATIRQERALRFQNLKSRLDVPTLTAAAPRH